MSESACARCHNVYELRDGCEPTKYCDPCAHERVAELEAELSEQANWRGGMSTDPRNPRRGTPVRGGVDPLPKPHPIPDVRITKR